jgi:GPH family glycoside/pentoside/hexuronide:cation symporter
VLRDRLFWRFTFVATLLWFTTGIFTIGTAFYAKYTLGAGPTAPSAIFGTVFIVAILSVSGWSRLVHRVGIKRTWLRAIGVMLLSAVALGLAADLRGAIAACVVAGAGLGGIKVCRELIMASLVDRSLVRTGRRQEGVYYSLNRFFGRLSKLLEALALLLLGLLFGYASGEDPGPNPAGAFRFLMSVLPFICMAAALLWARTLPLDDVENHARA